MVEGTGLENRQTERFREFESRPLRSSYKMSRERSRENRRLASVGSLQAMDLKEFKKIYVQQELGITPDCGSILTVIDFGNVNYWFDTDRQTHDNVALKDDSKLVIDLEKLKDFLGLFSEKIQFYYGYDPKNQGSLSFIQRSQDIFGKHRVHTKPIQKTKHHLFGQAEIESTTRAIFRDGDGDYVIIPKCNFDVEVSVDTIKTIEHFDTVCLLSGDADFVHLLRFLKQKGKRIILIKSGHITHQLKASADIVINAQAIKKYISSVKQKPGTRPGLADRNPESTGRTIRKDRA